MYLPSVLIAALITGTGDPVVTLFFTLLRVFCKMNIKKNKIKSITPFYMYMLTSTYVFFVWFTVQA